MHTIRKVLIISCLGLCGLAVLAANHRTPPSVDAAAKESEDQPKMTNTIPTLLTRNLNDVFGENDPAHRRKVIDEIFTEDAVFYDPMGGVFRGRDAIDGIAGKLRAMHPNFRYQLLGKPEEVGNAGRVRWTEGRPNATPEVAGTDFIVTRDGRIAAIYLFFDKQS